MVSSQAKLLTPPPEAPQEPKWPASVPTLVEGLRIIKGEDAPPAALIQLTEKLVSSLTFEERAALFEAEPYSAVGTLLCQVAATRWRIAAALKMRPTNDEPPAEGALDLLISDIDTVLQKLGELCQSSSADTDLQATCEAARASLARGISHLLPTTSAEGATSAEAIERSQRKETEQTLAQAIASSRKEPAGPASKKERTKRIIAICAAVFALGPFSFFAARLIPEHERAVPQLPPAPPGTLLLGDPSTGSVILSSANGQPLDRATVVQFTADARAAGADVKELGPTQLLMRAGSR